MSQSSSDEKSVKNEESFSSSFEMSKFFIFAQNCIFSHFIRQETVGNPILAGKDGGSLIKKLDFFVGGGHILPLCHAHLSCPFNTQQEQNIQLTQTNLLLVLKHFGKQTNMPDRKVQHQHLISIQFWNITSALLTNILLVVETTNFNSLHLGIQMAGQNGPSSLHRVRVPNCTRRRQVVGYMGRCFRSSC